MYNIAQSHHLLHRNASALDSPPAAAAPATKKQAGAGKNKNKADTQDTGLEATIQNLAFGNITVKSKKEAVFQGTFILYCC